MIDYMFFGLHVLNGKTILTYQEVRLPDDQSAIDYIPQLREMTVLRITQPQADPCACRRVWPRPKNT